METLPSTPKKLSLSLEEITLQKEAVKAEIAQQQKIIMAAAYRISAPFTEHSSRIGFLTRTFGTGFTILQGVIFGIKMLRKFRSFFR